MLEYSWKKPRAWSHARLAHLHNLQRMRLGFVIIEMVIVEVIVDWNQGGLEWERWEGREGRESRL